MRVVRSRWSTAVLLMIAAGSPRVARADQPSPPPSPAAPPLTSVSPPTAGTLAAPSGTPAAPSGTPAAPSGTPATSSAPPAVSGAPAAPPLPASSGQPPSAAPPPPGATPPPPVYWYPPPGYLPPYDMGQLQKREHRRTRLPKLVTHKPGMPVYDGYHLEERRPRWPLALGLPAFGVGYAGAVFAGLIAGGIAQDEDAWAPMFIPVVGPFVTLETAERTIEFDGERVVMVATGVLQITGLAIVALHWVYPSKKMLVLDGKVELRPASFAGTTGLAAHF